jgi:hypothetical protein
VSGRGEGKGRGEEKKGKRRVKQEEKGREGIADDHAGPQPQHSVHPPTQTNPSCSYHNTNKQPTYSLPPPVTIYEKDTTEDPCSGPAIVAAPLDCYPPTYVYYSIDFCDPAAVTSSTSTPSTAPTTPPATNPKPNTAAIAGGVVGGVLALALLSGAAFWAWRRQRKAHMHAQGGRGGGEERAEVHGDDAPVPAGELHAEERTELGAEKVVYRQEAAEVAVPPVEIGSSEVAWRAGEVEEGKK